MYISQDATVVDHLLHVDCGMNTTGRDPSPATLCRLFPTAKRRTSISLPLNGPPYNEREGCGGVREHPLICRLIIR